MGRRDRIWAVTLNHLVDEESFKLSDIQSKVEAVASTKTAQRVWADMEEEGYLVRESEHAKIWHRGPQFMAIASVESTNQ